MRIQQAFYHTNRYKMRMLVLLLVILSMVPSMPLSAREGSSADEFSLSADGYLDVATFLWERSLTEIDGLQVHFIDVGQGDAILVTCGDAAMLIDAGDEYSGTKVQYYLMRQNVSSLDYVVATHPDSDHIGGMDVIATKYEIGTFLMPADTPDTNAYQSLLDAMDYRGIDFCTPKAGDSFSLGRAKVTILSTPELGQDINNNSIVLLVKYGKTSFLFTGDAETEEEYQILERGSNLSADVLKVGHHGSSSSTSEAFLSAVSPKYAVISCGKNNSYGHPTKTIMERLGQAGIKLFRTDDQGSIVARSDGSNLFWNKAFSANYECGTELAATFAEEAASDPGTRELPDGVETEIDADTEAETATESAASDEYTYPDDVPFVGNVKNLKLHDPHTCQSPPKVKNTVFFYSLEEAEAAGYTEANQCGNCRPFDARKEQEKDTK